MKTETVAQMWDSFAAAVFAGIGPVSDVQRQEMRRAFFAGAWAILQAMKALGDDGVSEDAGVNVLERWEAEMRLFQALVSRGGA